MALGKPGIRLNLDRTRKRAISFLVKTLFAILALPLLVALSSCGDSHDGDNPPKKAAT